MAEEKTDLGSPLLSGAQLETILDKVLKDNRQDIETWQRRIQAEHEDNMINISGYTAVLDIGINTISSWDGCNGYYEMRADEYVQWQKSVDPDFKESESDYTTKQGLSKIYRFPVMINDMAEPNDYNFNIVKNTNIPDGARRLFTAASEVEMIQRRV